MRPLKLFSSTSDIVFWLTYVGRCPARPNDILLVSLGDLPAQRLSRISVARRRVLILHWGRTPLLLFNLRGHYLRYRRQAVALLSPPYRCTHRVLPGSLGASNQFLSGLGWSRRGDKLLPVYHIVYGAIKHERCAKPLKFQPSQSQIKRP